MLKNKKMALHEEYGFNDFMQLSPKAIRKITNYHIRSISQFDQSKGDDKKIKMISNLKLPLKVKIKKPSKNGLRNIYEHESGKENGHDHDHGQELNNNNGYLTSSQREKLPRSILKKKISSGDTSSKGISFSLLTTNLNKDKERDRDNKDSTINKGESKTVSFHQENNHIVTIYQPKSEIEEEIKDIAKSKCKCDCIII